MIKVDCGNYHLKPPAFVFDDQFTQAQQALKDFYLEGGGQFEKQQRLDTKYLLEPVFEPISAFIAELFSGKCAYSEQKISHIRESNLHFHRPVRDALDEKGQASPDHYWWLMFDWKNWYLATELVRHNAANFFPVIGKRSKISEDSIGEGAIGEGAGDQGVLLDPCYDQPVDFLSFDDDGRVQPRPGLSKRQNLRAKTTIRHYALNDKTLIKARYSTIRYYFAEFVDGVSQKTTKSSAQDDYFFIENSWEFAGCLRQCAVRIVKNNFEALFFSTPFQKEYQVEIQAEFGLSREDIDTTASIEIIDADANAFDQQQILRHESIQHIEIRHFKGISHLDLSLVPGEDDTEPAFHENRSNKPWSVFLGENGCGKSSILQAIAWALAYTGSESSRAILGNNAELFQKRYLRRGETQAEISLWFGDNAKVTLTYDQQQPVMLQRSLTTDSQLQVFVRAYGATRLGGESIDDQASFEQIRIMNLLDPDARLIKPEDWLLRLHKQDPKAFNRAAATLLGLMPHHPSLDSTDNSTVSAAHQQPIRIENNEVIVYDQPLSFVSDGYRSVITLACDMMAGLAEGFGDYASAPGIIIIDEMGAHLHPRWRMKIVNALKTSFPNLQFIVSTHEPLCLRGLRAGEVVKVEKQWDENQQSQLSVERVNRNPSQLRVDQLLTSEFFGLDSTIDPAIDEQFGRYYRLLAKQQLTDAEEKQRQQLKQQLYRHNTLGYSRRDRMVYELIDHFLAKNPSATIAQMKPDTRKEIIDLLQGNHYFPENKQ